MPTLFFLHIPKCAGMTLTEALLERLPAGTVYQSTSMIRNFRENRPEFLEVSQPTVLKAVVGHWVHEAMLPVLQRPIYLATSLRHPVDRVRSQYRFDVGLRGGSWPTPEPEEFLRRNQNVMVNFLTRAFPSITKEHPDRISAAKAILSGLDGVFDISEADTRIERLLKIAGAGEGYVTRSNESTDVNAALDVTDAEIAAICDEDMALYEWFMSTNAPQARPSNRVFNPEIRTKFARLIRQPFNPDKVAAYLAPKYATELRFGLADRNAAFSALERKKKFAERVITSLTKQTS